MSGFSIILLLVARVLSFSRANPLSRCFSVTTWKNELAVQNVSDILDPLTCQGLCYENAECIAFTHHNDGILKNFCYLFSETSSSPVDCDYKCLSGPRECDLCSEQVSCSSSGDGFLGSLPNITTETQCQYMCYASADCSRYTWHSKDHPSLALECQLFNSCDEPLTCDSCATGPDDCAKCLTLKNIANGQWECPYNDVCYLQCDPGFVSLTETQNFCSEGSWTYPTESFSCGVGVALIQGGYGTSLSTDGRNTTEIYSDNLNFNCNQTILEHAYDTSGHSMEWVHGVPMMCGGTIRDEEGYQSYKNCWVMEDNQDGVKQWKEHNLTTQKDRSSGGSVENHGILWLIGGASSPYSTEYLAPGLEWESGDWLKYPLHDGCVVRFSGDSFIAISAKGDFSGLSNMVRHFFDGRYEYEVLESLRTPRTAFACALVKNETFSGILVAGGKTERDEFTDISELYNFETKQWHRIGNLNIARDRFEMLAFNGGILAFGGEYGMESTSSVEKLNLSTGEWKIVGNLKETRTDYAATLVPAEYFCQEGYEETTTTPMQESTSMLSSSPLLFLILCCLLMILFLH